MSGKNSAVGKGNDEVSCLASEKSTVIPILAHTDSDDNGDEVNLPPEYAMIEVNGNLIAPVEFPPGDSCREIFGADRRVELGKLYMKGPEKASTSYTIRYDMIRSTQYIMMRTCARR